MQIKHRIKIHAMHSNVNITLIQHDNIPVLLLKIVVYVYNSLLREPDSDTTLVDLPMFVCFAWFPIWGIQ